MNSNRRRFIKLHRYSNRSMLYFSSIFLTILFIAAYPISAVDVIKPKVQLPDPKVKTCASYGYTCASGYTCTLDTRLLGVPSITTTNPITGVTTFAPKYACTKSSITYKDGCPEGWYNRGGNVTVGEFICKADSPICKYPETFPWPAPGYSQQGYFCIAMPERLF